MRCKYRYLQKTRVTSHSKRMPRQRLCTVIEKDLNFELRSALGVLRPLVFGLQWRIKSNMTDTEKRGMDVEEKLKDVKKRVKELIAEQLGVDESKIIESASFANDMGADSLDLVELVMALEDEFGVNIPDEDAEKIQTFGSAVEYVREKLQSSTA